MNPKHTKRNPSKRLAYILWNSDLEATRLGLAVGSLVWALLLYWPGALFTPERTTYRIMSDIAPEVVWATAFLIQGTIMLYSLLYGYKSRISFTLDAIFGCILWTTSTAACFLAHYQSMATYQPPAAMAYEVIGAMFSWWHLVRYTYPQQKGA